MMAREEGVGFCRVEKEPVGYSYLTAPIVHHEPDQPENPCSGGGLMPPTLTSANVSRLPHERSNYHVFYTCFANNFN